jgi:hypothetical protein
MRYLLQFLEVYFLLILFLMSCQKDDIKTTGNINRVERYINEDFKKVYLSNTINLIISQDTINKIEVECGENLLSKIKTEIINHTLYIRDENKFNWLRSLDNKINVYLRIKQLDTLDYNGSGDIVSTNSITGDFFHLITHNGSGDVNLMLNTRESHFSIQQGVQDITVKGLSGINYIYNIGENFFYGEELLTGYSFINNISSGDCYINATKEIGGTIEYVGNIFYKGNPPNIHVEKKGKGNLIYKS